MTTIVDIRRQKVNEAANERDITCECKVFVHAMKNYFVSKGTTALIPNRGTKLNVSGQHQPTS